MASATASAEGEKKIPDKKLKTIQTLIAAGASVFQAVDFNGQYKAGIPSLEIKKPDEYSRSDEFFLLPPELSMMIQEHQAKPLGTPVAPSSAGHTLGSAVRDKAPAALTASELRARAAEAASARAAASIKARVVSDASVAAGGSAQCAMATGGDAAWIPAALERLLPPNLKQKAGFVKQVQAALQVRGRCGGHGPQRCCPRVPTHLLSRACM